MAVDARASTDFDGSVVGAASLLELLLRSYNIDTLLSECLFRDSGRGGSIATCRHRRRHLRRLCRHHCRRRRRRRRPRRRRRRLCLCLPCRRCRRRRSRRRRGRLRRPSTSTSISRPSTSP